MYDALKALFDLFDKELNQPIANAINNTFWVEELVKFINNLINNIFRLFNNENSFTLTTYNIAQLISFIVMSFLIYAVINVFKVAFEVISEAMRGEQATQWRSSWKRRKRR